MINWKVLDDPDLYEAGEPHPKSETVSILQQAVEAAQVDGLATPVLSTMWGEVGISWHTANLSRYARLGVDSREVLFLQTSTLEDQPSPAGAALILNPPTALVASVVRWATRIDG